MIPLRRLVIVACTTPILFLSAACAEISSVTIGMAQQPSVRGGSHHHHGPPPHAPAHGYRHKQQHQGDDLELRFDSALGVYLVVGVPDRYYWNGVYLRLAGDQWQASENLHTGWKPHHHDSLPPGLRKQKKHHKANRGNSKKKGPARGHW